LRKKTHSGPRAPTAGNRKEGAPGKRGEKKKKKKEKNKKEDIISC
jgi:hypothetical protein